MIRAGRLADADAVAALQTQAWGRAHADFLPAEAVEDDAVEARRRRWHEILADPAVALDVWDQDGMVAGFACVGPARDADVPEGGELFAVYVHPVAQGAGVGRALLDAAEARLRGAVAIVWVFSENGMARDIYERRGWVLEPAEVIAAHHGTDWWVPCVRYRRGP